MESDRLFDILATVGLVAANPGSIPSPQIINTWPSINSTTDSAVKELMNSIPLFCWPDVEGWVKEEQEETLMSTNE